MKIDLKVTTEEGTYTVRTNLFVVVAWERKYKRKASELASGIGAEDLAYLAYEAAKQHGMVVPIVFDDYVKAIESIEVVGQEPENPTNEAHTDSL